LFRATNHIINPLNAHTPKQYLCTLLVVENPGYLFVRETVLQPWKKTTSLCTKKKGSSSPKPSSTTSSRRHSAS
jgi:hypothetical protein